MRWNDFALANAVLRAVPGGHSRKSFHRRALRKSSQGLDRKATIPIARQKKFAYLRLNKLGVLEFWYISSFIFIADHCY